ncbi:hypothetical protein F443_03389 [Phytophthora nicotianae P1569]|uniref:Uncharacterized protein n=1 Tax=Phytophthora nicotianae P1569 TaxID=1317065 RepID=V9FQE2_PHYNI|nr:hypothetical protein F443_03389 [Phytophthora nicotianae P1569]
MESDSDDDIFEERRVAREMIDVHGLSGSMGTWRQHPDFDTMILHYSAIQGHSSPSLVSGLTSTSSQTMLAYSSIALLNGNSVVYKPRLDYQKLSAPDQAPVPVVLDSRVCASRSIASPIQVDGLSCLTSTDGGLVPSAVFSTMSFVKLYMTKVLSWIVSGDSSMGQYEAFADHQELELKEASIMDTRGNTGSNYRPP